MFEPSDTPRLFGLPPGADFPAAIAAQCLAHYRDQPPEARARLLIVVNTERMKRRLTDLFRADGPGLLPRIVPLSALDRLVPEADLPPPVSPLARRLELARLIAPLLEADPPPAPRSALFDLSDSLAALLDELEGEEVSPDTLLGLTPETGSAYWTRSLGFLSIVRTYLDATGQADAEARRTAALDALLDNWARTPPETPVLVVGSTGSRNMAFRLMTAAARLPQGAVALPGYDPDLPADVWAALSRDRRFEDHPQYRFARLAATLGLDPATLPLWPGATAPDPARNGLLSLAMRPAPVTGQWRRDGPLLGDLTAATARVALIEAPQARDEAIAIAIAIRDAAANGRKVALISPDRTLGRRVTATLARWNIVPDDSGGRPVALTPPGLFLRQIGRALGTTPSAEDAVSLLKHPLTHGGEGRGPHLLATRELELFLRRKRLPRVDADTLTAFAESEEGAAHADWALWIADVLGELAAPLPDTLGAQVAWHIRLAEHIAAGPEGSGAGGLWDLEAGRDARAAVESLAEPACADARLSPADYLALFERTLASANTRITDAVHPDVAIWGTLEARVMGADLVILGGLNEGTWPARPDPDPWLNRRLRAEIGLLLPEREIGLSAHDFQQAAAAPEVILSRSRRDADAETVPARWLNRLTNLMAGLPGQNGPDALLAMKSRGERWLDMAARLDRPGTVPVPAPRPCPAPPVSARTKRYSVTEIEKLIRDPYAIYARYTLALRKLEPLRPEPDAALRGTVFHKVMERFLRSGPATDPAETHDRLLGIAFDTLTERVPWPAVRAQWLGHISGIARQLADDEVARQSATVNLGVEIKGKVALPGTPFELRGTADRIDLLPDNRLVIHDYKSSAPPSRKEIRLFKRQLLIEAVMAELGAFPEIDPAPVAEISHISLNREAKVEAHATDILPGAGNEPEVDFRIATVRAQLIELLRHFDTPAMGYLSRRAMQEVRFEGDYDQLARFGEWDDSTPGERNDVP